MGARRFTGRLAAYAVAAVAALGIAGTLGITAASAATTVTASTSVTNHPDTTSASGPACTSSPGGPVWAHDTYTSTITVTADTTPANTYSIAVSDSGTYVAFADPTTCAPLLSTGSLSGTYDLTVVSPVAPSAAGLKSNYDGAVSTSTMVQDLFGGKATSIVGGDYNFSYQGGNYVQNTAGATGDVKAVACTVTIGKIADQSSTLNKAVAGLQVSASSNYPGTLYYDASNLPKGLTIDHSTGKISGTPTRTSTYVVTVGAVNTAYSHGDGSECSAGTASFNWTVSLAPAPSPSPSSSPSGNGFPSGGVQTGGGKSTSNPWIPIGGGAAGLLLLTGAVVVLRRRPAAN